jgi:hypothetical protein
VTGHINVTSDQSPDLITIAIAAVVAITATVPIALISHPNECSRPRGFGHIIALFHMT